MSKEIKTALIDNKEVKKNSGRFKNVILDIKIKLFCNEYVNNGMNGTQAYISIYKNKNVSTAKVSASRMLSNPNIREYIVGLLPKDDLKEQDLIYKAFNSEKPKNISWRDIHKFVRTSLELKGKLNKDKNTDVKIGLVINN